MADAGRPRSLDEGLGPSDVGRIVGLRPDLSVDPCTVDDGVASLEGAAEGGPVGVGEVSASPP